MLKARPYLCPVILQQWETARLNASLRKNPKMWALADRMIERLHKMYGSDNLCTPPN